MIKILEIKKGDWTKGNSKSINLPIGGLFQDTSNFDPFEQEGLLLPSTSPATQSLGTTPKFLTSFNSSGTDYIYAHSATKLYQVLKDSPYTVTDVTAQINQGMGTVNTLYGRIKWKGGYVYAVSDGSLFHVRFNSFPVSNGNDVAIKTSGVILSTNQDYLPFCVGADGNLYYGNQDRIEVLTSATGTSGNSTEWKIDSGFQVRDLVNDGRYLVVIADNNAIATSSRRVGSYTCRIYFWDMVQTDGNSRIIPVAMYDINDSYMIAGVLLEQVICLIGYNGIYLTNVATQPRMIRPFPTDSTSDRLARPLNPSQVCVSNGSIYWLDGVNTIATTGVYNPDVFAYGNPVSGQQKIFYKPYTTGVNQLNTCILPVGKNFIIGTDTPNLNFFNVGTTRGTATLKSTDTTMDLPCTYDYTKVVLNQPLTSGQSVQVIAYTQGTNATLSSETISYNSAKPQLTLKFDRKPPGSNNPTRFEDITLSISSVGAQIQRVCSYATPLSETEQL